jgi:hypothetical protein
MLQKKHLCMALIFTLTSLSAAHASLLSLGGSWQLDGEVWSGQLQLPDWEENLLGIEEPPQVTNPSWTQKLNLGFSWQSQEGTGFGLELMDAGNWGVGYASDGSWGRQSTFGPLLIHEAFGYHDGGPWQLRAGRFQPDWNNSLLGGAPIALEGLEGSWQIGKLRFSGGAFRLSSLYWPGTDFVVSRDTLFCFSVAGQNQNLAWEILAVPDEFGAARALGGQVAFPAFGGIIQSQGALWQDQGKAAPALEVSGSWQWQRSALTLAVAVVDPEFAPILSNLGGREAAQLLSETALPFTTGSVGLAASWGRQLEKFVLEVHTKARKIEESWQKNLGAALYLPHGFSLAWDLLAAESLSTRLKAGWNISF